MKTNFPSETKHSQSRLQHRIPAHYNPYVFFGLTHLIAIIAMYYATKLVKHVQPIEWVTIPVVVLFANFVEYTLHRWPFHTPLRLLKFAFKRHLGHHEYFTHDQMGFDTSRELYMVLFPFWGIFLLFALVSPMFVLTRYLLGQNVTGLFLIVAVGYFLLYEWMHMLYHLPEQIKITQNPLIQILKRHHQTHHNKTLMNDYNFNVTFPIFDWVIRTFYHPPKREAETSSA